MVETPVEETPTEESAPDTPAKVGTEGFTYTDGLELYVTSLKRFKPSEYAAGHKTGNVGVMATVKIVNKTKETADLALTTVNMRGGTDGNESESIYDPDVGGGFSGKVAPGRSASAKFAFDVPPSELRALTVEVSPGFLDYESVLFDGSVKYQVVHWLVDSDHAVM